MLQRFFKEFEKVIVFVSIQPGADDSENSSARQEALTARLNYLRYKEFLVEMCFMTEQQATTDSLENNLAFELWELIAPRV